MESKAEILRSHLKKLLGQRLASAGSEVPSVADDFNLFESGLFDSIAFINLISSLEQDLAIEIDLEGHDPSDFSTVSGLVNCVVEKTVDNP